MPIIQVRSDRSVVLSFRRRRQFVDVFVSADQPVQTFAVDSDGLNEFNEGKTFGRIGGIARRQHEHRFDVDANQVGGWHLIIYNPNDTNTSVFYEVTT